MFSPATLITLPESPPFFEYIASPPDTWIILDSANVPETSIHAQSMWPPPYYKTAVINNLDSTTIRMITPFNDSNSAIEVKHTSVDMIFFIDSLSISETVQKSDLNEKYDIVIISDSDVKNTLKARDLLRPQYMIVLKPIQDTNLLTISNCINPHGCFFLYEIDAEKNNSPILIKKKHFN